MKSPDQSKDSTKPSPQSSQNSSNSASQGIGRLRHVRPRPIVVEETDLSLPGLNTHDPRNDPNGQSSSTEKASSNNAQDKMLQARMRPIHDRPRLEQGQPGDDGSPNHAFPFEDIAVPIGEKIPGSFPNILDSPVVMSHEIPEDRASPFSIQSMESLDDFDKAVENLPSRNKNPVDDAGQPLTQETLLSRLDGTETMLTRQEDLGTIDSENSSRHFAPIEIDNEEKKSTSSPGVEVPIKPVVIPSLEVATDEHPDDISAIGSWLSNFMLSASIDNGEINYESSHHEPSVSSSNHETQISSSTHIPPSLGGRSVAGTTIADATSHLSFPEAFRASRKSKPILTDWVDNKFILQEELDDDGTYKLGESKTVIVHEILRGNWTWCTAWSPDGTQLAIATENHHLAVVDTTTSTVWRVKHDQRVNPKDLSSQSIRTIAWGEHFIAVGGVGDGVSILAPTEPYQILHTIEPTGFVDSIDWLPESNKLLLGSRDGKATVHELWENHDKVQSFHFPTTPTAVREIQSKTIHTIDRKGAWVNAVQFKPGGKFFAIGDALGILAVYSFEDAKMIELINVSNFKLEDSILDIQWSADGKYLYAGGEDYAITVISTENWEPVKKIKRDRWVQFISSSKSSTHLAVGGVTSEVSILDVNNGWNNIINIGTKGLVPLSANWHPDDQYLVLTGQDNSILSIETNNARHVPGHFLRSSYPILSIAFSPDGRMAAIGNELGVVSIFQLSEPSFISVYEMVVECNGSLSVEWSPNGSFVAIAADNKVVILSRKESLSGMVPPKTSGFYVAKVLRDLDGAVNDVSIDPTGRYLAVSGTKTQVLNTAADFATVLEMDNDGTTLANSWSPDGKWFAAIGKDHDLIIYDTSVSDLSRWQAVFTVTTEGAGFALAWGKSTTSGLQYCAYGGKDRKIHIMEIRTKERSWETVLAVKRDGQINDLDWNSDGLMAAAVSNGTVTILDLSYLQSGWAVNEMDYNWQRQALTCFTEIRRNKGKHSMKTVKWIPSDEESDNFLAFGGSDGEVEIMDLSEREKYEGFKKRSVEFFS